MDITLKDRLHDSKTKERIFPVRGRHLVAVYSNPNDIQYLFSPEEEFRRIFNGMDLKKMILKNNLKINPIKIQ